MGSLQEQLVKAGLATPEQARASDAERRREARRGGAAGGGTAARVRAGAAGKRARKGPKRRGAAPPDAGGARSGRPPRPAAAGRPGNGSAKERGGASARRGGGRGAARPAPAPAPASAAAPERSRSRSRDETARPEDPDAARIQALNLRIRALLDEHARNDECADIAFSFARENMVRRVFVTDEQRRALASGEMAIVGFRRRHHLVPAHVADEIHALRDIVFIHRVDAAAPENGRSGSGETRETDDGGAGPDADAYRAFPVPDDLRW